MKQIDKTFYSLCEEIDDLKEAVEYWKNLYETERATNNKMLNDNLETAKQGVANALRFALSVSDDENGNLVISKENRKDLAENWIGIGSMGINQISCELSDDMVRHLEILKQVKEEFEKSFYEAFYIPSELYGK